MYRLTLVENDTHQRLRSWRFTKNNFIFITVALAISILLLVYLVFAFTPVKTTIPGYPDAHSQRVAISNAIKIDSLESIITRWEIYADNLGRVLEGKETLEMDSLLRGNTTKYLSNKSAKELSRQDSLLRLKIHESHQFAIVSGTDRELPLRGRLFFTPMKGVISRGFIKKLHEGVDITAPAGTVISSVLDGTVIFTGWDDKDGYTIAVQHSGDLVSIYRHNREVLRKPGSIVSAGTPISILGSAANTGSEYLHLELWYRGETLNPVEYIKF